MIKCNGRYSFFVTILLIIIFLLVGCGSTQPEQPEIAIKEFRFVDGVTSCVPGEKIGIAVEVDDPDKSLLVYDWSADEGRIKVASEFAPAGTFECPVSPGVKTITVKVRSDGNLVDQQSLQITVNDDHSELNNVAEPDHTAASAQADESETNTPEPTLISLDNVQDGQDVACEIYPHGAYAEEIVEPIWPVVVVDGKWHPQDDAGQSATKNNGQWVGIARFGVCGVPAIDPVSGFGKTFDLLIIKGVAECEQKFVDYLQHAAANQDWPGIPGTEIPQTCKDNVFVDISVVRQ